MEVKNERSTKSILQWRRLRELLYLRSVHQPEGIRGQADHYVRRYFHGGKDFEKTMKSIAVQRTTKNVR